MSSSEESEDEDEPRKAKKRPAAAANSESDDSDGENDQTAGKRGRRTAAWHDEDDDKTQVQDVVASYAKAKGKHGAKEVSAENYADSIRKKFLTMVDTPKWADLGRSKGSGDDSDDEFFRVRKIFSTLFRQLVTTTCRKIELDHFQACVRPISC